jgi:hypothetical protein
MYGPAHRARVVVAALLAALLAAGCSPPPCGDRTEICRAGGTDCICTVRCPNGNSDCPSDTFCSNDRLCIPLPWACPPGGGVSFNGRSCP